MEDRERKLRLKLKNDFKHYALKCLKIRTKGGSVEPFVLNKAQDYIHQKLEEQKLETGSVRALILKGRQQGCSTLIGARFYHLTTHSSGIRSFILTHELNATQNLYDMVKRYYEYTPEMVKPEASTYNSKELEFGNLDSGYKLGTAGTKTVGRSATIQLFHGSECGFWENAAQHATGIFQAIPELPGTEIILESTANGVGNFFHQMWQQAEAGQSDFQAIFVPWFWQEEYSRKVDLEFRLTEEELELANTYMLKPEQMAWRRAKVIQLGIEGVDGRKAFNQEYPNCAAEAFILTGDDNYIDSELVVKAQHENVEGYGPLVMGVDPARFGEDRTSIMFRQGRRAFDLSSYVKKDTMEVTGLVHTLIEERKPAKVFVDVGGLGAGVVDRLYELGHRDVVVAVNAGSSPLNGKKYLNKRAEMWGEMREWLADEPCQLPESNSLHADLCGPKYTFDSNSRLQIESKEKMKKRGIRSPDNADSLCLTFAMPAIALEGRHDKTDEIVAKMAAKMRLNTAAKQGIWRRE